jgi:hypothetical protein
MNRIGPQDRKYTDFQSNGVLMNDPDAGAGGRRGRRLTLTRSFLSARYHTGSDTRTGAASSPRMEAMCSNLAEQMS